MKKTGLIISLVMVIILAAAAFAPAAMANDTEAEELTKVTVILDYVPNTNHTGMYVALDKGYYAEEGLDVTIIEPTDGATNTLIAMGTGTFGITYQEDLTLAKASADPLPIKAIAALIQHNTSGFVTLADTGITSPSQWEGLTYAGWGGIGEEAVVKAVMARSGADFTKISMVISDGLGFESLGRTCDLMWFFEAWDLVQAEMNGVKLNYVACRDLDERLDYYTPIIVTSEKLIESDPALIEAFLRATEKGYYFAMEDPDAAAEILYRYAPDYDPEMLKISQEYLADKYMEDADQWGEMKDSVWDNYTDFMVEYGVMEESVPAAECYTNEFLGK